MIKDNIRRCNGVVHGPPAPHATIKPIETVYQGYRFRSRLEARWAVFFDALEIPWVYEKEGFDLGDAGYYLPDFWLPRLQTWVEIKPDLPTESEEGKLLALAERGHHLVAVFVGSISNPTTIDACGPPWDGSWYQDGSITFTHDSGYAWCACTEGLHFGMEYQASGARIQCDCPGQEAGGRGHWGNHPKIIAAYRAARSARFEHGETPA